MSENKQPPQTPLYKIKILIATIFPALQYLAIEYYEFKTAFRVIAEAYNNPSFTQYFTNTDINQGNIGYASVTSLIINAIILTTITPKIDKAKFWVKFLIWPLVLIMLTVINGIIYTQINASNDILPAYFYFPFASLILLVLAKLFFYLQIKFNIQKKHIITVPVFIIYTFIVTHILTHGLTNPLSNEIITLLVR
jgi:hypothetical protein